MESVISAYMLDGEGGGTPLKTKEIGEGEGLYWLHLYLDNPDTEKWLTEKSGLDPFIIEAMIAEDTRPRILRHEKGALIILHGVNLNKDAEPDDMVSVRIWIEADRIITVRRESTKAIAEIEKKIVINKGPKTSGEFIVMLIKQILKIMEPTIESLDEMVDMAEEKILLSPEDKLREDISEVRFQAIVLKRHVAPQREVIKNLGYYDCEWLGSDDKLHVQENCDIITRYVEDLNEIKDRCQIVHDELESTLSYKLNRNMYTLSVIAAIFLPLSFVTSLFGINVGGIPGAVDDFGFWWVCILLGVFVLIQIAVFKKLKWF